MTRHGRKRRWQSLILALGLVLGSGAGAHSDEHLATVPAPHGGQLRMAGAHHLELVVLPDSIRVYVTDHAFQPVSAAGAKGSATVWSGGKRTEVPLKPAGGNLLSGKGRLNPAPDARVKVRISLPGQKAESAEFTPLRVIPPAEPGSQGHEAPHR